MNPEAHNPDGPPTLLARRQEGRLIVWCDHCRQEHQHGLEGGPHRIAHCADRDSPYRLTGYLLRVAPKRGQGGYLGYLTVKGLTT